MLEAVLCLIALVLAGWAIAKNYDAKVVLFVTGLILLYLAVQAAFSMTMAFCKP